MTEIHDPPAPRRDELRLLLEDLACVSGTLSEIMTVWRRAQPGRPELRLGRLVRLQDAARQLAADIEVAAGRGQALDPALSAAGRLAAFEEDAAGIGRRPPGPDVPKPVTAACGSSSPPPSAGRRRGSRPSRRLRSPASRTRAAADRWGLILPNGASARPAGAISRSG